MRSIHALVVFQMCWIITKGDHTFTLLHTNDVHARFVDFTVRGAKCSPGQQCFGGVARLVAKIKEIRRTAPNVALLDAGDQFQGSVWFYVHHGMAAAHFMERAGYDVMALGNHEFDLGVEGLVPFIKNVSFPVISCNIDTSGDPTLDGLVKKSTVLNFGWEKVGVIGYTTQETPFLSHTGNVVFNDVIESLKEEVMSLKGKGITKIIALGHAGFVTDLQVAREVDGIDVVIGGHSNTFLYTGDPPSSEMPVGEYPWVVTKSNGERTLVVQDYAFGKYLGFLQVDFDDMGAVKHWTGNPILLDDSVQKDGDIMADLEQWSEKVEELNKEVIGHSNVLLDGSRTSCRLKECNMGNLLADAAVTRHLIKPSQDAWARTAVSMLNGGGIRSSIAPGNITYADLISVSPFGSTLDLIEIKGQHILEALEHSVEGYDKVRQHGKFLQVSGIQVKYNLNRPDGQRVCDVKILCTSCLIPEYRDLDPNEVYSIITSSFIASGGDGYDMISKNMVHHHIFGDMDVDVLMDYVRKKSPIVTGLEGRIQFMENEQHCMSASSTSAHQGAIHLGLILTLSIMQFMRI